MVLLCISPELRAFCIGWMPLLLEETISGTVASTCTTFLNNRKLQFAHRVCLWALFDSQNRHWLCVISGSHISEYDEYCLLWCDAVYSGRSLLMFWRNILPLSSRLKIKPSKQRCKLLSWYLMQSQRYGGATSNMHGSLSLQMYCCFIIV
jgi:hypothetical protein